MESDNLFHGKRIYLAARRSEDTAIFARWSLDAEYQRMLDPNYVRPLGADEVANGFGNNSSDPSCVSFRIRTLAEDQLIGFVMLFRIEWNNGAATLGLGIGEPEYRGKGYGSEALQLVLRYGFCELNLYRIGLEVISYNERALRAYAKAGFQHEGVRRAAVLRDGVRSDRILMGLLREEWLEQQCTIESLLPRAVLTADLP